jgi:N-acetylneuraminic acid mutarotase
MEVRGRRVLCIAFLCKFLYRLDLETFIWKELESRGTIPDTSGYKMEYYNGSLYLFVGTIIFIYDLNMENWSKIETSNEVQDRILDSAQCFYKEKLYTFKGWDKVNKIYNSYSYIMDLSNDELEMNKLEIDLESIASAGFGYNCIDGILYMFGGYSDDGYSNSLSIIDFNKSNLKLELLSRDMNVPTPRQGHAMQVYDDKLYIFGGVDGNGNR